MGKVRQAQASLEGTSEHQEEEVGYQRQAPAAKAESTQQLVAKEGYSTLAEVAGRLYSASEMDY